MLPLKPRRTAQEVSGARRGRYVYPLPLLLAYRPSHTQHRRGEERDANNLPENSLVALPPYPGTRAVLRDENMLQRLRVQASERDGDPSEREEIFGEVVRLLEMVCREIVVPAEGDHSALARVAVELKLMEGQLAHAPEERLQVWHCSSRLLLFKDWLAGKSQQHTSAPPPSLSNCGQSLLLLVQFVQFPFY